MIYIRVDANNIIATGHLMRCIAIAEAIEELGEGVTFIFADNNGVSLLNGRFRYIILDSDWNDKESELGKLCDMLHKENATKLIIDSYQVTKRYLSELKKQVRTIYIDDINKFHYDVDLLICYASYYRKNKYEKLYPETDLLLGCDYVPLRREFRESYNKEIKESIEEILILSGGTDPENFIGRLLNNMSVNAYKRINAVCGKYNLNYDLLNKEYKESNVNIIRSTQKIIDLMRSADLVISAAGVTLYELCACGIPALSYVIADNQVDNAVQLDKDGIIQYMGDIRKDNVIDNISKKLTNYSRDERIIQSDNMRKYVDKNGAMNIARKIIRM